MIKEKEKEKKTKVRQKREVSTTTKGHYVTNATLLPAVIEAKKLGYVTDKLIRMIKMIAERYSRKYNFVNYSFREDMVSVAVMNLCNNALKFNVERSDKPNPFSYYTSAIHNSFLQYIGDEKRHRILRDTLLIDAGSNPSFNFMEGEKDEQYFEVMESDEYFLPPAEADSYADIDPDAPKTGEDFVAEGADVDGDATAANSESADSHEDDTREAKIRYQHRIPGKVTRYGPNDIEIDAQGNITIKVKPQEPEVPAKKTTRKSK